MAEWIVKRLFFDECKAQTVGLMGGMQNSANAVLAMTEGTTFSSGNWWTVNTGVQANLE